MAFNKIKISKTASEWADILLLILPIGWVLTCYDGGWSHFESGNILRFLWHLFCGCFSTTVLLGLGLLFSGQTTVKDKQPRTFNRWTAFAIEIVALFLITSYLH